LRKSKSSLGFLAIGVIVAIVLLVIGGIYYYTQLASSGNLVVTSRPCFKNQPFSASSQSEPISGLSSFAVEGLCIVDTSTNATAIGGFVYVASTASQQAQGFQNVSNFGDCNGNATSEVACIGMIFVTPNTQNLCFWMHNTEIPLQQVWISSSSLVVTTYQAQPNNNTPVCHFGQFVLETFPSAQISLGQKVVIYNSSS
jgi:uncharacterized membrane protein (UPF0127 family)